MQKEFMKQVSGNYGIIYNVLKCYVDEIDQADVQQDILLSAWKSYPKFRSEAKFSTWLHTISFNTCRDYLRKKRSIRNTIKTYEPIEESTPQIPDNWYSAFIKGFFSLCVRDRKVVYMFYLNDLSIKTIAEKLNINTGSVLTILYRSRNKIRLYAK